MAEERELRPRSQARSQPERNSSSITAEPGTVQQVARAASQHVPTRQRGKAKQTQNLQQFEKLPAYLKDNEFIVSNYRINYTIKQTLLSLFRIHNETGNVWTHLIGFFLFLAFTIITAYAKPAPLQLGKDLVVQLEDKLMQAGRSLGDLPAGIMHFEERLVEYGHQLMPDLGTLEERLLQYGKTNLDGLTDLLAQGRDNLVSMERGVVKAMSDMLSAEYPARRWPIYVFTAGAMLCMLTSSVCHLFGCCQDHIARAIWRFDYAGIAVLIVSSFYPPVYYGFMCDRYWMKFYLLTTTLLGVVCTAVSLMTAFQAKHFRPMRAALFAGLGLWGIVPIVHFWCLNGNLEVVRSVLGLDLLMGVVYLAGAAIYALRIPERWKPGAFDLAFHSHQIFHVAVVVAAVVHFKAVQLLVHWRDGSGGCQPASVIW